ncbi:MAG TPA: amidase family protein [Paenirhodobacter sp.]
MTPDTRTAADLGRAIGAGKLDPVALTQAFLDAIAAHPHAARIYARLMPERAMTQARAAAQRARAGQRLGPLDGVPISWKDLFDTAGTATEGGTRLLTGRVPDRDADVVAQASAQGLIGLGKTHMTEIAYYGLGHNPMLQTPPNVHDPALLPGGSSSGAAVSVGFGLAAAAIGSDTGGSVRLPAAWNDLVGLKTTHGRLSMTGVLPLSDSFDTIGPLCRSVEDAGLLLAALGGTPAPLPQDGTLRGKRFAILTTVAMQECRDIPGAAFEDCITRLSEAGAIIDRLRVPEVAEALDLSTRIVTPEANSHWLALMDAAPDRVYPAIHARLRAGADELATDYLAAWARLREIRRIWHRATADHAAILMPTSAILPPDAARILTDPAYLARETPPSSRNSRITNLMGGCAITLPTARTYCGITLVAPPMAEDRLLHLAGLVEAQIRQGRAAALPT